MTVQAWFARDEISVTPGDTCSLSLSVEHLGEHSETYAIIPAGPAAAWTTVTRPTITLFAGSREVIDVVVHPPAVHSTSAGPLAVAVRVVPSGDPDGTAVAEAMLHVEAFDDRRISVLQPMQRARRRATYEFLVENRGNDLASCRLHLVDPTSRLDGSFDPPAVGVAPGSSTLVRLRLRATQGRFRRTDRQLDFGIEATQPDHRPAVGHAALVQPPTVPLRTAGKAVGVAAVVAALVAAWFGVVRPELRSAAERAVDDRLGTVISIPTDGDTVADPAAPAPVAPVEPAPPPADPGASTEVTESFVTRVQVTSTIGVTAAEEFVVPDASRWEVTDVVLQNPFGDLGTAVLLRNDEVLYVWDLGLMAQPSEFQPRVTPIPLTGGDRLVLRTTCEASGDPAGSGCDVAVLLGGLLVTE